MAQTLEVIRVRRVEVQDQRAIIFAAGQSSLPGLQKEPGCVLTWPFQGTHLEGDFSGVSCFYWKYKFCWIQALTLGLHFNVVT